MLIIKKKDFTSTRKSYSPTITFIGEMFFSFIHDVCGVCSLYSRFTCLAISPVPQATSNTTAASRSPLKWVEILFAATKGALYSRIARSYSTGCKKEHKSQVRTPCKTTSPYKRRKNISFINQHSFGQCTSFLNNRIKLSVSAIV